MGLIMKEREKRIRKITGIIEEEMAISTGFPKNALFGKTNEVKKLTGAEVSKKEFMKTYTSEQIEVIQKEVKKKAEKL